MITEHDWSFSHIREQCPQRAARLESLPSSDELIIALRQAFEEAFLRKKVRISVDSLELAWKKRRTTLQFQVNPKLYDWFHNGRTGYRAQFLISVDAGMNFNSAIVLALRDVAMAHLSDEMCARCMELKDGVLSDVGETKISRNDILRSLAAASSKIWICENLSIPDEGKADPVLMIYLRDDRSAKLGVPNWMQNNATTGLLAPFPPPEHAWLDLKSGFIDSAGGTAEKKPASERALDIHCAGWT